MKIINKILYGIVPLLCGTIPYWLSPELSAIAFGAMTGVGLSYLLFE